MTARGWSTIALAIATAIWFSWMFRYEHAGQSLFLDRWTGELVSGFDGERFALNTRNSEAPNPFADLIPTHQGRSRAD